MKEATERSLHTIISRSLPILHPSLTCLRSDPDRRVKGLGSGIVWGKEKEMKDTRDRKDTPSFSLSLASTVTNLSKSWPFGLFLPHQQTHSPASCIRWPLHPILTIHFIHAFHSLSLQHGKVIEKKGKREDINNKQMKGEELTILTTIIICWRDKFTSPQLNSKSYHSPHPSRS